MTKAEICKRCKEPKLKAGRTMNGVALCRECVEYAKGNALKASAGSLKALSGA